MPEGPQDAIQQQCEDEAAGVAAEYISGATSILNGAPAAPALPGLPGLPIIPNPTAALTSTLDFSTEFGLAAQSSWAKAFGLEFAKSLAGPSIPPIPPIPGVPVPAIPPIPGAAEAGILAQIQQKAAELQSEALNACLVKNGVEPSA